LKKNRYLKRDSILQNIKSTSDYSFSGKDQNLSWIDYKKLSKFLFKQDMIHSFRRETTSEVFPNFIPSLVSFANQEHFGLINKDRKYFAKRYAKKHANMHSS